VPFADVNCQVMPQEFTDHQLLFLSDIFPTGYMAVWHATCNRMTPLRCGGAGRWGSSRSAVRSCWVPAA
jgi:alcohol dehydrogenase